MKKILSLLLSALMLLPILSLSPFAATENGGKASTTPLRAGQVTEATFYNADGEPLSYKIYLPQAYKTADGYLPSRTVMALGTHATLPEELASQKSDLTAVYFDGSAKDSAALLATLIKGEYVNKYLVFALGKKALTDALGALTVNAVNDTAPYTATDALLKALLEPNELTHHSILEGLTFYAMGDSYFHGSKIANENTWVNRMGERYGMHYVNYGKGGSTMSAYADGHSPMVNRWQSMEKGDADFILLEGGRNDRNVGAPLGDIDGRDIKTFYGAVNTMLDGMLKAYPRALIILVTPWYHTGPSSADGISNNIKYADALRDLAEHRNNPRIVCLYAADKRATGVNMDDKSFRNAYTIEADTSHLNLKGMMLVEEYMESVIAAELTKYRAYLAGHTHSYGDWVTVKAATQTVPGQRIKTCECGDTVKERIPVLTATATAPDDGARNNTTLTTVVIVGIALGAVVAIGGTALLLLRRRKRA